MAPALSKGLSQDFAQKSAFDILQSLKRKEFQETTCTICLGHLGGNSDISSEEMNEPVVSMISCGHFFCTKCLDDHIHSEISKNKQLTCPICRGKFNKTSDVSLIDHNLSDDEENERRREEAKAKVLTASDMLASSEGVALDGELWNALYLAIPLPTHVSHDPHHLHTALPRDFLAHVRAATAMTAGASRTDKPFSWSEQTSTTAGLSSKIQQLLHDLPMGEHAVVFSTTKDNVIHLETVLKAKLGDDEVFSLYTGQDTKATEKAVSTWSSRTTNVSRRGPTLIVQAGAAASGLTLTTASKLFIMEPFNRQEEEQQAYARLHRYGQKNDVHVKIYYAPVSVESRLLVWRRRSAEKISSESNGDDAQFVYNNSLFENDLLEDDEGADEESLKSADGDDGSSVDKEVGGSDEDDMRTQFLLGLVDEEGMRVVSNTSRDDEEETDYDDAQHPEISVSGDFILE
jgi:SNF2 family DNA or RNA helicase